MSKKTTTLAVIVGALLLSLSAQAQTEVNKQAKPHITEMMSDTKKDNVASNENLGIGEGMPSLEDEASTAMAQSQNWFLYGDFEKALNGDSDSPGFIKIVNDYSGTKAANLANYYAGLCLANLENWNEAVKYLENFKPGDDIIASPLAVMALGDCYANIGKYEKAIESFKKAAKMADDATYGGINYTVPPVALKKAAIILSEKLNKKDEALEIFKTIKGKYFHSPVQQDIDKHIEELER